MRDASALTDRHRAKFCVIYIRQSSYAQVERNRESTARQYDLSARAAGLGWPKEAVLVIDEDLGLLAPFVKEKGFNFPVIPAYSFVQEFLDMLVIPQN